MRGIGSPGKEVAVKMRQKENLSLPRDLLEHAEKKRRRHRILYLAPAEYCPVRNVPVEIRVRGRNLHRINCDLVNLGV